MRNEFLLVLGLFFFFLHSYSLYGEDFMFHWYYFLPIYDVFRFQSQYLSLAARESAHTKDSAILHFPFIFCHFSRFPTRLNLFVYLM